VLALAGILAWTRRRVSTAAAGRNKVSSHRTQL